MEAVKGSGLFLINLKFPYFCDSKSGVMLLISQIKENKLKVINGLLKKKFPEPEKQLDRVLELDNLRKETQFKLDEILAESNLKAKRIGSLIQEGKKEEAETAKSETAALKSQGKALQEVLQSHEQDLREINREGAGKSGCD